MSALTASLQRAVHYALSATAAVTPDLLPRPTPCSRWNLRMLVSHLCQSVAAFQEGLDHRRIDLLPTGAEEIPADPTNCLQQRATQLLNDWAAVPGDPTITIADHRIPLALLADAAALEITIHAWDILQASGHHQPIPAGLASDLLTIAPQLVHPDYRRGLFAPPLTTTQTARPNEQLLAFLGRPSARNSRPSS